MNDDTIGMMLINDEECSSVMLIKMTTDVILVLGAWAHQQRRKGMEGLRDGKASSKREGCLPLFHVYEDGLGF